MKLTNKPRYPLKTETGEVPKEFDQKSIEIIQRILSDSATLGIVYFRDNFTHMCTVPASMRRALTTKLPPLSPLIYNAVTEMDPLDDLIAYRIETISCEILVAGGRDFGAVVVQTRANKKKQRKRNM